MNLVLQAVDLPIRIRTERKLSDDELMAFCAANELTRVERDANGELIVMSPRGSEGSGIEGEVGGELFVWARLDGRGKYFPSTAGFTLPDTSVRAADAAWVSWPRWNALTAEQRKSYAPLCPEFVIEVRSESDRLRDLQAKMRTWIVNGAELAWLIDPNRRVVEVYRPGESAEMHHDPTSVQGTGCVRGFELIMARIWG
jgi:Uma2 family endonuclease